MLIVVWLANGTVRRAGTRVDSLAGWCTKTSEAKWSGRPVCIGMGREPVSLGSSFRTGTRARRALAQTLFLGSNVRSSARDHAICQSSARIWCGATRTGWLRYEWVLRWAHSRMLRQAWGSLIVYVMFNCGGRHEWNSRSCSCLPSLCRGVIGVVATWVDRRSPRFDFFVPNRSDNCASFAAASTTE